MISDMETTPCFAEKLADMTDARLLAIRQVWIDDGKVGLRMGWLNRVADAMSNRRRCEAELHQRGLLTNVMKEE